MKKIIALIMPLAALAALSFGEPPSYIATGTVTIKETLLTLSPKLELALPNGAIDIFLRNRLANAAVDYRSKSGLKW